MNNQKKFNPENPFKVPENYFETLNDKIKERILTEEQPQNRDLLQILKPYVWMTASLIGFVLLIKSILILTVDPQHKIQQISQVTPIETETSEVIPATLAENQSYWENSIDASSDEIIEYLTNEDIDSEIIITNL